MKTLTHHTRATKPGFASLLTVTSVGVALLIILISMYENTIESQAVQSKNMLKADYQQREDAFLRALVSIVPNKAMIAMQDNSNNWDVRQNLRWRNIIDEALAMSNSETAVDANIASSLGIDNMRQGNIANTDLTAATVVKPLGGNWEWYKQVTSGTNIQASTSFPPPLECSGWNSLKDGLYPMVGYHKTYGDSAEGWVQDSTAAFPLYNRVLAPKLHFNYQSGQYLIAKHNWWAFELSFASEDASKTKLSTRKKKYLLSLYEVPSQLPISASTYAVFGAHSDGTDWAHVTLDGGVFGQKVKTEGAFNATSIASRQGVELSAGTTVNGKVTGSSAGANPFAGPSREQFQSQGNVFPISSSSDGGRVAFVPINRGLEFYDRYAGSGDSANSSNAVSPTSWDYYSIGAKQCRMRLDVIDVVSANDQTPTAIRFSYWKDNPSDLLPGSMVSETFTKGSNWPDEDTDEGDIFPFHVDNSSSGRPCVALYMERLVAYMQNNHALYPEINNSISINVDHVNNISIEQPPFPSSGGDLALMLLDGKNLTSFTKGLSLITNLRLIIADDINITPAPSTPSGVVLDTGEDYYPPLSMFAPEKRYGDSTTPLKIDIDGQLGSLAKGNSTPVRVIDLKSGAADEIIPDNITANLRQAKHPAELAPINMMNWMVIIREIHPRFVPESTQ